MADPESKPRVSRPLCSECAALGKRRLNDDDLLGVRAIYTEDALAAIPQAQADQWRHFVGKLIAIYELPKAVRCRFPDHQPHKFGFVVETLCGKTLAVGNVCGKRHIDDAHLLRRQANDAKLLLVMRAQLAAAPNALLALLGETVPFIEALERVLPAFELNVPNLMSEVRRRFKLSGGPRSEVSVANSSSDRWIENSMEQTPEARGLRQATRMAAGQVGKLVGHAIVHPSLRMACVRQLQAKIAALTVDLTANTELLATRAGTIREMERHRIAIERDVKALNEAVADARRFFNDDNMRLWQRATLLQRGVFEGGDVNEGTFGIEIHGQRFRLGLMGRRPESATVASGVAKGVVHG